MERMETGSYVNYPARPKPARGSCPTERNWSQIVLLSFGLLCLVQATLNITLRLVASKPECNSSKLENQTSSPAPVGPDTAVKETQQCNGLQGRVKALKEERNRLENKNGMLNIQITKLNLINNQLNNQVNDLTYNNCPLTNQNSELRNQIDRLINENRELNSQIDRANYQISELNNRNSQLSNQVNDLNNRLRDLTGQIKTLQEANTAEKVCPDGWLRTRGRCYFLSSQSQQRSWNRSRTHCQSLGADLVVINNEQEQRDLYQLNNDPFLLSWIGLHDDTNSGTFKWVDNTPLTSAFWQLGQPGDGGPNNPERCVEMYHGKPVLANWNDARCGDSRRWVCEKEARPQT